MTNTRVIDGETFTLSQAMLNKQGAETRVIDGETFTLSQAMLKTPRRWYLRPWATRTATVAAVAAAYRAGALRRATVAVAGCCAATSMAMYVAGSRAGTSAEGSALAGYLIRGATLGMDKQWRGVRAELLKNVHGRVLDVGCAAGLYLQYFADSARRVTEVVALEPNATMHAALRDTIARVAPPFPVVVTAQFLEELPPSFDRSFDSILLGNVLCEVPDVPAALAEVDRLLRPGGRVYFSEHVLDAPGSWRRALQRRVNPWWSVAAGGCNCDRDSLREIQAVPGWTVESWTFRVGGVLLPWLDRFEVGVVVKNGRCEVACNPVMAERGRGEVQSET